MSSYLSRDEYNRLLGVNYRRARLECGATQQLVAECCTITRSQIANVELGRSGITIYSLHQLCAAIGADINNIIPALEVSSEQTPTVY